MKRRHPTSTRTDTRFPYTTLFRSPARSRISARREGDLLRPDGIYRAQRALGGRRHRVRHRRRRYLAAWQQADRSETRRNGAKVDFQSRLRLLPQSRSEDALRIYADRTRRLFDPFGQIALFLGAGNNTTESRVGRVW